MQDGQLSNPIPNVNAELSITDYTQPIKLHFHHEKFWHIWLSPTEKNVTIMKTGKLINQITENEATIDYHEKLHSNEKQAIESIKNHITQKRLKGYEFYLSNPKKRKFEDEKTQENEKKHSIAMPQAQNPVLKSVIFDEKNYKFTCKEGEYLELAIDDKDFHFFQIEILENFLKITKGKTSTLQNKESSYQQYSNESEAKTHAIRTIGEKIAFGYSRSKPKFKSTFNTKDLQDFKESLALQIKSQTDPSFSNKSKQNNKSNNAPNINVTNPDLTRQSLNKFSDNGSNSLYNNNYLQLPGGSGRKRKGENYSITSKISDFSDLTEDMRSRNSSRSRSPSPINNNPLPDTSSMNLSNSLIPSGPTKLGNPTSKPHDVLLAETWDDTVNPTGYLMSEKLDGVRCLWTGERLYSRNGNQFFCPPFFTKNWPNAVLDGELWIARNTFQQCVRVVKKKTPEENDWKKIQYLVFDTPSLNLPFDARYKLMDEELNKINNPYIKLVHNRLCTSRKDMDQELEKVLALSGEGLMLRNPKSFYERKRSKNLLKVKKFLDDEALVIGHIRRPQGDLKAMQVRLKNGKEFKIGGGLTDAERRRPPKIGSTVTFKYQNLSEDGIPRFPIYLRPYDKV